MEINTLENSDVESLHEVKQDKPKKKRKECGIIYLSRIPTLMNVNIVRRYFEKYGDIGKIFLQPDLKAKNRGKRSRAFSEGWVEFLDKSVAKQVAASLNNAPIGGKKKNQWREELWNMKYLHRFKWAHLNERMAYEKAVHSQRMRTEISQAKRQASFYMENAEKSDYHKKVDKKRKMDKQAAGTDGTNVDKPEERIFTYKFKETDDEIRKRKKVKSEESESRTIDKKGGVVSNSKQLKKGKAANKDTDFKDRNTRKSFFKTIFASGLDEDGDD